MKLRDQDIEAGRRAIRVAINETGYGSWVSDDNCRELAIKVLQAVWARRRSLPQDDEDRWEK